MVGKPCPPELLRQAVEAFVQNGCNISAAARATGVNRSTIQSRLRIAQDQGYDFPAPQGNTKEWRHNYKDKKPSVPKVKKQDEKVRNIK